MAENSGVYRVLLDHRWTLTDLHKFPHNLNESYAFYLCLDSDLASDASLKIDKALQEYSWRGGWSIVHIYDLLQASVPPPFQTEVRSIKYESPGWLDLVAHFESIEQVARSVYQILGAVPPAIAWGVASAPVALKLVEKAIKSAERIAVAYAGIQKILRDNRRDEMEHRVAVLQLEAEEVTQLGRLADELAQNLGFKTYPNFVRRTGDEEAAAKLLCAQYRRLRNVANYVETGQAALPTKCDEGT